MRKMAVRKGYIKPVVKKIEKRMVKVLLRPGNDMPAPDPDDEVIKLLKGR